MSPIVAIANVGTRELMPAILHQQQPLRLTVDRETIQWGAFLAPRYAHWYAYALHNWSDTG